MLNLLEAIYLRLRKIIVDNCMRVFLGAFTDLYWTKWALALVCSSFIFLYFFWLRVLESWSLSAFISPRHIKLLYRIYKINERIENKPLSHHISLPLPFTPYLTLISFADPFIPSGLPSWILTWIKGVLAFYRAMYFSAKRGIAIACRLSVRLSVCDVGELWSHRLEFFKNNFTMS